MKLNIATYLLICLIEECAEIIVGVCKAIRFGLKEEGPDEQGKRNNAEMIEYELADLDAVRLRLSPVFKYSCRAGKLPPPGEMQKSKIEKMEKYEAYAREQGTLEKEPASEIIRLLREADSHTYNPTAEKNIQAAIRYLEGK